jgi:hypothetical protein
MSLTPMLRGLLALSGIVAMAIGGAILVAPAAFYAGYGIAWASDADLASELQGGGGLLLGSGVLIATGAVVARLSFTATVLSSLLYLGYAAGRLASAATHGLPSTAIALSGAVELGLGLASLLAFRRSWRNGATVR